MKRSALANKILMLGIDGMDPRLTRKYVDEGKMPNVKKYIERGSCREDLVLLGGHPTVTPPMWTTLATGCYANVHGITAFYRASDINLDTIEYNMDSRNCHAEPLWNVFAEAGKNTLVWHWPGSSWPPTSDDPHLMVVDGTSPGSVGMAVATVDNEFLIGANVNITEVTYRPRVASDAMAPCVVEDLKIENDVLGVSPDEWTAKYVKRLIVRESQRDTAATETPVDVQQSPIKEAYGWENAPEGAKEFTVLFSKGLLRCPALILRNENGIYDKVSIFKNKKAEKPLAVLEKGIMVRQVMTEAIKGDSRYRTSRNLKILQLEPDGSRLTIYVSAAIDIDNDSVYHPKRLFKEITENVGYPTPTAYMGCQDKSLITDCMLDNWYASADWQAKSILHLIETENLDVVFSHFHNVDLQEHCFIKHLAEKEFNRHPHEVYAKFLEDVYIQTDYYLGQFIHLLDEGWTILIFSDHALVSPKHDIQYLAECSGVTVPIMQELGFTFLKTDENGNEIEEIDWTKTKAIAQRECNIYVNLKGRDPEGIVDPADKYELEEEIMTALYGFRDAKTGHRVVSVALRNKDAVLLGYGGPECGDIVYWMAEGYNNDHDDCLSTTYGEAETSVSPIFIATGPGFKQSFKTERIIRQIDVVPTVAVLGGVRMPAQCEGAPVYQIFEEEY